MYRRRHSIPPSNTTRCEFCSFARQCIHLNNKPLFRPRVNYKMLSRDNAIILVFAIVRSVCNYVDVNVFGCKCSRFHQENKSVFEFALSLLRRGNMFSLGSPKHPSHTVTTAYYGRNLFSEGSRIKLVLSSVLRNCRLCSFVDNHNHHHPFFYIRVTISYS